MVTALHIARQELPMSHFLPLINLQKKNGVRFVEGKSNAVACANFIDILADCLVSEMKSMIATNPFFLLNSMVRRPSKPRSTES